MDITKLVSEQDIAFNLSKLGFQQRSAEEGRLMLLELLSKAGAGYYNSHSEELFLNSFGFLIKKDRMPSRLGMRFIAGMVYASSNKKPACFNSMLKFRG